MPDYKRFVPSSDEKTQGTHRTDEWSILPVSLGNLTSSWHLLALSNSSHKRTGSSVDQEIKRTGK